MNFISYFWNKHKVGIHAAAGGLVTLMLSIDGDMKLRDRFLELFSAHPKLASDFVILSGIVALYLNARKARS